MPRPGSGKTVRVEFTRQHDNYLVKYLATYSPSKECRSGNTLFKRLVANEEGHWPWSAHHTWQSWRERYVKNSNHFDRFILNYQTKHNIDGKSVDKRKRAVELMPIEMLGQSAKRVRREEEEEGEGEEERLMRHVQLHLPNTRGQVRRDLTALQTRHDVLEILFSPPDRQAPPQTDGRPEPSSPSRPVKRIKARLRTPSGMFTSNPSTPRRDASTHARVGGPSSQTRPAPSATSTGVDGAPAANSAYPRAPPRVVDSLHGQVLVDREGHVPHALLHGEQDRAEEEEEKEEGKARWPPARGRIARSSGENGADVGVSEHHPFSQSQSQPRPEAPRESVAMDEREGEKPNQPFGGDSRTLDGALLDRRAVAARFSGQVCVAPQVESERGEDMIRDGASPVKRVVAAAPPSDASSGLIPKPLSKALKFPAPRASTRSPFRPEPPVEETRHPPLQPQRRPRPPTRATRHPALTRIRRQTTGHGHGNGYGNGNGHESQHRREHASGQVPSVDLVALSHSSMSARSHSRSSAGAS